MTIRPLDPSDASVYRALRLQALGESPPAFGSPVDEEAQKSQEEIESFLKRTHDRTLFGAFVDSAMVGMLRYSRYSGSNEGHRSYIASFYVDPEHRRQGIGRALLEVGVALAEKDETIRRVNLTVVSDQTPAIRLYETMGFSKCGTDFEVFSINGKFYDEILMTKPLKPNPLDESRN